MSSFSNSGNVLDRRVIAWQRDLVFPDYQDEEPFPNADLGWLLHAQLSFKKSQGHIEQSTDSATDAKPTKIGEPLSTYQRNGFQIIETTQGYTVRPIVSNYTERVFRPFPRADREQQLELCHLISQARSYVQPSETVPARNVGMNYQHKPDSLARGRVLQHWNTVCELLDRIDMHDLWPRVYGFCRQKSEVCQDTVLHFSVDDALKVYGLPTMTENPGVIFNTVSKLASGLERDLSFVLIELQRMIRSHATPQRKLKCTNTAVANMKRPRSVLPALSSF